MSFTEASIKKNMWLRINCCELVIWVVGYQLLVTLSYILNSFDWQLKNTHSIMSILPFIFNFQKSWSCSLLIEKVWMTQKCIILK